MGMSIHHGASGIKVMFGGDEAREILISAYKNQGKLEALLGIFEGRLEEDADNPALLEMLAEIHRNAEDHEKAAEAYQTLCKVQPSNVRSFYYAAAALHKGNQPELAKELMDQGEAALSANTRRQDMWFLAALASICLEGEMYEPAIKFVEDAIAAKFEIRRVLVRYQRVIRDPWEKLLRHETIRGSRRCVSADGKTAPDTVMSVRKAEAALRRVHREGNLYEKQIPEKLQHLAENPEDLDVRLDLAQVYEWSDSVDEAIAQYEKMVERQPDNAEWYKKIGDLTRKSRHGDEATRLTKAVAAYEKAIQLEPTSYQSYDLLAQTYVRADRLAEAAAVYRRALDASLEERDYNSALRGIWELYADAEQEDRGIAVLEELESKVPTNAVRLELLGDAYKEADAEKADAVYAEWLAIRQKEVNREQRGWDYRRLADQLLRKGVMPEKALELAERASQMQSDWNIALTLGHAYVANDRYEEALEQFTRGMNGMGQRYTVYTNMARQFWTGLAQAGKNATDEERYIDLVKRLVSLPSSNSETELYANGTLAQFYHQRDRPEKAKAYMDKTAFIPEEVWWIIGPFDNADGIGYNKVYIPETETQFDTTAEYDGIDGQVHWKKQADDAFDGFVDFREIFDKNVNWNSAYAWTTVDSPDEREVQLHFGSGTQAKLWLNGEGIFTHSEVHTPAVDQDTYTCNTQAG